MHDNADYVNFGATLMRESLERLFRLQFARRHEPESGGWQRARAQETLAMLRRFQDAA